MPYKTVTNSLAPDFREISSERSVVLPNSAKLIPLLFWVTLSGILFSALVVGQMGKSKANQASDLTEDLLNLTVEVSAIEMQIAAVEEEFQRASSLYDWVTQVPMIQPFLVSYFDSFKDGETLSRASLSFSEDIAGQFSFETVFQGNAATINALFQRNTVSVAKDGWNMAQTNRNTQGNTIVISSLVRVEKGSPWTAFGHSKESFIDALNSDDLK